MVVTLSTNTLMHKDLLGWDRPISIVLTIWLSNVGQVIKKRKPFLMASCSSEISCQVLHICLELHVMSLPVCITHGIGGPSPVIIVGLNYHTMHPKSSIFSLDCYCSSCFKNRSFSGIFVPIFFHLAGL